MSGYHSIPSPFATDEAVCMEVESEPLTPPSSPYEQLSQHPQVVRLISLTMSDPSIANLEYLICQLHGVNPAIVNFITDNWLAFRQLFDDAQRITAVNASNTSIQHLVVPKPTDTTALAAHQKPAAISTSPPASPQSIIPSVPHLPLEEPNTSAPMRASATHVRALKVAALQAHWNSCQQASCPTCNKVRAMLVG